MNKTIYKFGDVPVGTHSWSADSGSVALSLNDREVKVMKVAAPPPSSSTAKAGKFETVATLAQHDLRVTGIDWAPKTNRIVTCSADRNAYVWNLQADGQTWAHSLVLLRINRAATCVRWAPQENKFAVGSGARSISICYFEQGNDWWVAKHIKKPIRSTVTAVDWHPNNCLLAAGCTGFKVRVYSGYVKDIEDKPTPTSWGARMPFQNLMAEFSNSLHGGGWVHAVSFSADGERLAWVGHDSSVSVADATKGMAVFKLKTAHLPFLSCIWISPSALVCAGHGCVPMLFNVDPSTGQASFVGKFENDDGTGGDESNSAANKFSARAVFQNRDKTGRSEVADTILNTTHQNQISCIRIHSAGGDGRVTKISTSAGDGKIVVWDMNNIESKLAALKI